MSTSGVSSTSLSQQLQQYFQTRQSDLQQLGKALSKGDLTSAQTAYNSIVALGQSGPSATGNPFRANQREQDFANLGQALQSGDLAGAQQAFSALGSASGRGNGELNRPPSSAKPSPAAASGPEIIVNLSGLNSGNATPEQITINISNPASGGEQISIGIGTQGSNPEKVTFNLPSNSNEEIVLNLQGAFSSTGSSSTTNSTGGSSASGGFSVSA